ncbi:MAG: NADH-quinone oxidoreductase subunit N [Pseudarcicella sp.]|nr:NADH-quinone oxidoreductase subunit N [Pseudarcicella sp.]MBP6410403.1 NADH-quinone oxidoreductase subunit N [Pseudarcicella sp.]
MNTITALSISGILSLFLGFSNNKKILLPATLVFILIALGVNIQEGLHEYLWFGNMMKTNHTSACFTSIILVAVLLVTALSKNFESTHEYSQPAEYYALMQFAAVGAIMMVTFQNIFMLFVGIEILSVSMYVLTGSDKTSLRSNEAALKYFLMGAFATAIFLFGVALVYGATGSFDIYQIGAAIKESTPIMGTHVDPVLNIGVIMLFIGLLFKISAAPFHFWTPDVYEGAPSIFTAFMSTVVKTAGIVALYKILSIAFPGKYVLWGNPLIYIIYATLIISNITALYQKSFKRMMAYSSISHAGYLLISILAFSENNNQNSISALFFYSVAYTLATIAAFGVLMAVSEAKTKDGKADESIDAFNGLAHKNPLLAVVLGVSMLSLSGIPLTAGFLGKLFVFTDAFSSTHNVFKNILTVAILMSTVGIYYYFKPIIAAFFKNGNTEKIELSNIYKIALIIITGLTLLFGIAPDFIKNLI